MDEFGSVDEGVSEVHGQGHTRNSMMWIAIPLSNPAIPRIDHSVAFSRKNVFLTVQCLTPSAGRSMSFLISILHELESKDDRRQ